MALDPITAILNVGNTLIEKLIPDKGAQAAAKAQLLTMQVQGELSQLQGQMDTNKVEAASQSIFVAGWRPFIGWVCGTGLAYQFVFAPLFTWVTQLMGHNIPAPPLDMGTLMTLLMSLLGLGSMRTVEKVNGVNAGH